MKYRGMGLKLISLFFFVLIPSLSSGAMTATQALTHARAQRLWEDPQWTRLLHYHTAVWSRRYEGQPDGPGFFLSPEGKRNPQSELEATITGFFDPTVRKFNKERSVGQSIRCQFPARFRFISKHIGLSDRDLPAQKCPDFDGWMKKLSPKSATLVFSSYFLNNPSSTFGHSLIRINKTSHAESGERFQLLDYGINFAANKTTDNPLVYAVNGFLGYFEGVFSAVPYYYKVREYNDFETRDLWEYDLNLSDEEVIMLTEHFWELGSTFFDYFYLTENCSFHMLTALEAAAPRLTLTDKVPFWIIPADTIKAIYNFPGLVKKINFRPSVWTQFQERLNKLTTKAEREQLDRVLETHDTPPPAAAGVLDAAMDFIDFKYGRELLAEEKDIINWKQKILVKRSKLPALAPLNIPAPEVSTPHLSHDSLRVGLKYISNETSRLWEPSVRFALHDQADPARGYPPYAKIEFMHLRFRYNEELSQLILHQGLLVALDSFSAFEHFQKNVSWRAQLGIERVYDERCNGCLPVVVRGGPGVTFNWVSSPLISQFVLMEATAHYSSEFPDADFSLTLTPLTGLRIQFKENLILFGELRWPFTYYTTETNHREGHLDLRFAPDLNWAINLGSEWDQHQHLSSLGLYHYF